MNGMPVKNGSSNVKIAANFNAEAAVTRKDQRRADAEQRQSRSRDRKAQKNIVQQLESEIHELEARHAELVA